jgi:3'-5' exoribonuclease
MNIFVMSAEAAQAKNNSTYLRIRYSTEDKLSKTAVMFDSDVRPEDIRGKVCSAAIVHATPSDRIEKLAAIEGADPSPYMKSTKFDPTAMLADLRAWTRGDGIRPELTKIVDKVLLDVPARAKRFSSWPAAVGNHHAFMGGLLEHTWSMARVARAALGSDPSLSGVDGGVVMAAVVLHDLGKMFTYEFESGSAERTNLEFLLGHISIADEVIVKACVAEGVSTTDPSILNLRHCVLSHHGLKEWGSPVVPATREAVLLHQLDMIQSRGQMALEATEGLAPGARSGYSRVLDAEIVRLQ